MHCSLIAKWFAYPTGVCGFKYRIILLSILFFSPVLKCFPDDFFFLPGPNHTRPVFRYFTGPNPSCFLFVKTKKKMCNARPERLVKEHKKDSKTTQIWSHQSHPTLRGRITCAKRSGRSRTRPRVLT